VRATLCTSIKGELVRVARPSMKAPEEGLVVTAEIAEDTTEGADGNEV
jgi:hypothetical protein